MECHRIAFLKMYIMVSSLAPDLLALMDHSWYHSLNGLFPILLVYMSFVASSAEYDGIKCFAKSVLNAAQVPKLGAGWARMAFCPCWAQSPAGVPILKCVSVAETRLLSSV